MLTRPCIEAFGEKIGFLPGNKDDKISPYMLPIFDIIHKMLNKQQFDNLVKTNTIRTIPLAYQRGVTFDDSIVVADEMQNSIPAQVRLLLTRIGRNTKIVIGRA